ncbi:MAG TPA: diacylglycerol kinase family protein [Bryobacteraceae bacterium]
MYNPRAGKFGRDPGLVGRAADTLRNAGHTVTVAPTTGPRTAGTIARQHVERGADLIVAAGGDGTINETAEGMMHSPVPLAILPGGTANVLAMEMKIGKKLEEAAHRLSAWRPRRISVGHVTCDRGQVSRHFLLMAGIGLDAQIVYYVNAALKARAGKFAYWVAGWKLLGRRLAEFEVETAGQKRTCSFALLAKVKNYGGDFEIAREVTLFDDRFEAVLFEGGTTLPYVKYFVGMATNRLSRMKGVCVLRPDCLRVSHPAERRVFVQIDGEFAGHLPAEFRIVPDALTLLVPPEYVA